MLRGYEMRQSTRHTNAITEQTLIYEFYDLQQTMQRLKPKEYRDVQGRWTNRIEKGSAR